MDKVSLLGTSKNDRTADLPQLCMIDGIREGYGMLLFRIVSSVKRIFAFFRGPRLCGDVTGAKQAKGIWPVGRKSMGTRSFSGARESSGLSTLPETTTVAQRHIRAAGKTNSAWDVR